VLLTISFAASTAIFTGYYPSVDERETMLHRLLTNHSIHHSLAVFVSTVAYPPSPRAEAAISHTETDQKEQPLAVGEGFDIALGLKPVVEGDMAKRHEHVFWATMHYADQLKEDNPF
jgi:hypothetical protein